MRYQYSTELLEDEIPEDAWGLSEDNNASYYPSFLFIPYEMLFHGGKEIRSIPRCFDDLLNSEMGLSIMHTHRFIAFMMNCYTMMVWQVIRQEYKLHPVFQVYSENNPAVIVSRMINFWIKELEIAHILPCKEDFLNDPYYRYQKYGYQNLESAVNVLTPIILPALKKYGFDKVIETAIAIPCHEDFSHWHSTSRIDFERKWYHSRTKLYKGSSTVNEIKQAEDKSVSEAMESILNGVPEEATIPSPVSVQERKESKSWNTIHIRKRPEVADKDDMISCIETQVAVNDFLMQIPQEDYDLLMMGFQGKKQKEIAAALNLETHSAVSKRRKRLIAEFEQFSGIEINKKAIRRKKNKM